MSPVPAIIYFLKNGITMKKSHPYLIKRLKKQFHIEFRITLTYLHGSSVIFPIRA
jgi:hypothetical protein